MVLQAYEIADRGDQPEVEDAVLLGVRHEMDRSSLDLG